MKLYIFFISAGATDSLVNSKENVLFILNHVLTQYYVLEFNIHLLQRLKSIPAI